MSDDPIRDLLEHSKVIAVVGLSSKPHRPSYGVARYMQTAGYRIIPVNPNEREVLGEKCYARLEDIPIKVDIVDIFRRSEFVPLLVESAVAIGACQQHLVNRRRGGVPVDAMRFHCRPEGAGAESRRNHY